MIKPHGEKMKEIVMQHGPTSPEARRQARLLAVVSRVQLLALFLVVADMVLKPTSDDPWTSSCWPRSSLPQRLSAR